jgi:hypothetical protein
MRGAHIAGFTWRHAPRLSVIFLAGTARPLTARTARGPACAPKIIDRSQTKLAALLQEIFFPQGCSSKIYEKKMSISPFSKRL